MIVPTFKKSDVGFTFGVFTKGICDNRFDGD